MSAAVFEDGGFERLFEVLDGESDPRGSDTARDNVIPLFGAGEGAPISNQKELGRRLAAFLTAKKEVVELCYDDKDDWSALQSTLHAADRWTTMASRLRAHDIADEICSDESNAAADDALLNASARQRLVRGQSLLRVRRR